MAENKICAYIDILGFKEVLINDRKGAIQLISDYQEILNIKKTDEILFREHYAKKEKDIQLKSLFESSIIDSFEYFIPFSDAAFVVSADIDKFILQISNFFIDTFLLSGYKFADHSAKSRDDLLQMTPKTKWYPLLFRGGISYGECIPYKNYQIIEGKVTQNYNLIGKAVAEAVKNENIDKGPRLFCDRQFYDMVSKNESRQILIQIRDHIGIYEILWPMPYIMEKGINRYQELLEISLNLWLYFNHEEYGLHYFKLLELIVKSIFEAYKTNKNEYQRIMDVVKEKFHNKSVDIKKIRHILSAYCI